MSQIAPSILAADFNCLGQQIRELEQRQIEWLHIDVMDGQFVPSISFGMPLIASIRKQSSLFFDVHLMIQEPMRYYGEFVDAGADGITIHAEACRNLAESLRELRQFPVRTAVSVKPATPLETIMPYLEDIDMVLIMGVEPGFGGQTLIPDMLEKIRQLKRYREEKGLSFLIEIDGGVNAENIRKVVECGTDIIVAGTAVFRGDIGKNIDRLKEVISGAA